MSEALAALPPTQIVEQLGREAKAASLLLGNADTATLNAVLGTIAAELVKQQDIIIDANKKDLAEWSSGDQALYDRLVVNKKKVRSMIQSVSDVLSDSDPIGKEIVSMTHPKGMKIVNRTAPFGTVLIIYESRPDVTIEAACVAFKSNNKILLKGGKEALHTNRILVRIWKDALQRQGLDPDWVTLLEMDRSGTQSFLKSPSERIDLIVPRGGDGLIDFVKRHATCPVLVSGRGNNFLFVDSEADWNKALDIIINAKTHKISACNALDKVLFSDDLPDLEMRMTELIEKLNRENVEVLVDDSIDLEGSLPCIRIKMEKEWSQEYLAMKIALSRVKDIDEAIQLINTHSGGHSNAIVTENELTADRFMNEVDAAAVYHNASTRFTDGGQFGMGAELAISTDKLHHRGPLGLDQLVTNKWFVFGAGQIRD